MNILPAFRAAWRLGLATSLALAGGLGQAQVPRIKPAPQPVAPAPAPPGSPSVSPLADSSVLPQTQVLGGRASGAGGAAARADTVAGPYSALQLAQSFLGADFNRDGELTRAEAQRLTIAPYSFEEMDRNRDGILTRFEYEDAVR